MAASNSQSASQSKLIADLIERAVKAENAAEAAVRLNYQFQDRIKRLEDTRDILTEAVGDYQDLLAGWRKESK